MMQNTSHHGVGIDIVTLNFYNSDVNKLPSERQEIIGNDGTHIDL